MRSRRMMNTSKFFKRLARTACRCGAKRLMPGPFYDREKVRCQECGARYRINAA